jgi:hypothetical protein
MQRCVFEDIDDILGDLRGLFADRAHLLAKRRAIRDEMIAIEKEFRFGVRRQPLSYSRFARGAASALHSFLKKSLNGVGGT